MSILKKIIAACAVGVAVLAAVCAGVYALSPSSEPTLNASIEETQDRVKLFIGDIDGAPEGYAQQRIMYIENTANENEIMQAVIGLDDYYTVETISDLAKTYNITVDRVYMWPKGETGRLALNVEDGNIEARVNEYKQQVKEDSSYEGDGELAKSLQRFVNDEYGIFALSVTASAEALETLNAEADCISYIDVLYNAEVEAYAKKIGKPVSYIELPDKPDGAL